MRIQHNIMAMNAYRNYNNNTSALSKNLEKLSSGYKINRAGDDAAGLAISEKMRAQITGLEAAQKNVKDGISLINTAEGALQEVQDMLNRMVYLAQESANGTFDSDVDRPALQDEILQLRDEIDRISQAANFNGITLFDGTYDDGTVVWKAINSGNGAGGGNTTAVSAPEATLDATNAAKLGTVTVAFDENATDEQKEKLNNALKGDFKFTTTDEGDGAWGAGDKIQIDKLPTGFTAKIKAQDGTTDLTITAGTDLETGTGNDKIDATKDLAIDLYDGTTKVATITVGKPTAGATGNTTVTFAEPAPAAAVAAADGTEAAGPTLTADDTKLAVFDVKSVDVSGVKAEIAEGDKLKLKYDGDGTDGVFTATIGTKTFTGKVTKTSATLGGTTLELTGADAADGKITLTFADAVTKVGTDKIATGDSIAEAEVGDLAPAADDNGNGGGNAGNGNGLVLQIGDSSATYNQLTVGIATVNTQALKIDTIDITQQTGAQTAVGVIKDAINYVSAARGKLGAYSNRLDHTANNLSVMRENIQDAESSIRDTDVAEEMMAYTKNNILVQSAQAMLAQANQVPQGVLQLLQ